MLIFDDFRSKQQPVKKFLNSKAEIKWDKLFYFLFDFKNDKPAQRDFLYHKEEIFYFEIIRRTPNKSF